MKIIYFIAGMSPTDEEKEDAEKIGTSIFRNASKYSEVTSTENCDFVAGLVPEIYSKFPRKDEVVSASMMPSVGKTKKGAPTWNPN